MKTKEEQIEDIKTLVDEMLDIAAKTNGCVWGHQLDCLDDMLHTMACKAAIKANDNNLTEELQYLTDEIFADNTIRHCPHGRPVMFKISKYELEKQFKRTGV